MQLTVGEQSIGSRFSRSVSLSPVCLEPSASAGFAPKLPGACGGPDAAEERPGAAGRAQRGTMIIGRGGEVTFE